MRDRTALKPLTLVAVLILALAFPLSAHAQDANAAKARALVDAAIKMSDSDAAVKLLWQATEIAPADETRTSISASTTTRAPTSPTS